MEETKVFLTEHCARYPALQPQDLLKAIHQSVFGCGHFIEDEPTARNLLRQELEAPGPPRKSNRWTVNTVAFLWDT